MITQSERERDIFASARLVYLLTRSIMENLRDAVAYLRERRGRACFIILLTKSILGRF